MVSVDYGPRSLVRIDPAGKGTVAKQETPIPAGLTVVADLDDDQKGPLVDAIMALRGTQRPFRSSQQWLHLTVIGISSERNQLHFGVGGLRRIEDCLKGVLSSRRVLSVRFDLVRPGYPDDEGVSDGTVVAMVSKDDSQAITDLAKEISDRLAEEVDGLSGNNRPKQPMKGVWVTLGYFSETFDIDVGAKRIFDDLKDFSHTIEVNKLDLVEFKYKSLKDAKSLSTFALQP